MVQAEQVRKFLNNPFVQWNLKILAKKQKDGHALVDHVMAAYAKQEKAKPKYLPYLFFMSLLPGIAKIDKAELKETVCIYPFYRRSAANVCDSVAKLGLSTPQLFTSPLLLVWNFTNMCNLTCRHCYQNARKPLPDELTLEERLRVVDQLYENNVAMIAFSGGEPLIHKDFLTVAKYAHSKGLHVSVATNGTLVDKQMAKNLKEAGVNYVEISIDSIHPEKHDAFRGGPGHWEQAVQGIKNLVEVGGIDVGIAFTATRNNFDEIDAMIQFSKDLKVGSFYVFNFIPTGRGKGMVEEDLNPAMREQLLGKLYKELLREDLFAFTTCPQYGRYCYQANPEDNIAYGHYGFAYLKGAEAKMLADYIGGCGAGRVYSAIQPNGKITPCVFMPIFVGDLRKQTLKEIWENSEVLQQLRDRSQYKEHCGQCEYRAMCGGCRARAYGYLEDYLGPDPGCVYNQAAWDELNEKHKEEGQQAG